MKAPTDKQVKKEIEELEAEIAEYEENAEDYDDTDVANAIASLEDRIGGIKWARGLK